ncbi:hypothetical protein BDW60DRAFT_26978 [Aspergillus nidulans var. acristatus]
MPPVRFGPRKILEYDGRYGVLICHECRYAIQKSALQSHLLRHKIYRADRQQLVALINELDLLEPDDVLLPPPESPPVDGLPVIAGYRCTAPGCANLCASLKRMKGHWRESHGLADASLARPAKLQTFFRGTKIRYFEVTPTTEDEDGEDNGSGNDEDEGDDDTEEQDDGNGGRQSTTVTTSPGPPAPSVNVDLETLSYFHHFTSATSLTLPSPQDTQSAAQYWQEQAVPQALQQRWLMCGLLALAACHLAAFPNNAAADQQHRKRAAEFSLEFRMGWKELASTAGEGLREVATEIECLLRCAHWALAESPCDQRIMPEPGVPEHLQSIITTIQSTVPPATPHDSETPTYATRILRWDSPDAGNSVLAEIRNRLRNLPARMADTFGRPENIQDVFVLLSAVAALGECCDTSFASEEIGPAWWGMATWWTRVPLRFKELVARHYPASLVVVAHWAALTVNRTERCGCWLVKGLAMTILLRIAERLPEDDDGNVQRLVALTIAA